MRSSLLIQARDPRPETELLDGVAGAADELGDPADGPPDRARRQAPDLGDVAIERGPVDAELVELLVEQVVGHAVEEQVDGEDDDDEVVEPAEDRDVVGDEVAAEDEVAGRAGRAAPCAPSASARRCTSASDRAGRTSGRGWRCGRKASSDSDAAEARRRRRSDRRRFSPVARSAMLPSRAVARSRRRRVGQRSLPASPRGRPDRRAGRPRRLTSNVRSVSWHGQGGASDQARRRAQGQDPRLHRGDAARPRLSAVGPRDRACGRARLHVGRPPPPPDPRARGLPGARRRPVARDPPDADRRDPARPDERARPAGRRPADARVAADHRRDRRRRSDRGLPGRVRDDGRPGHARPERRRVRPARSAATR